mmetsp:Transcript_39754/g.110517  ORF Transcript_39754/g.110517 Transcript_39754/m.110517 type:complete len:463 (-) Transcript_39754:276-1664(-)
MLGVQIDVEAREAGAQLVGAHGVRSVQVVLLEYLRGIPDEEQVRLLDVVRVRFGRRPHHSNSPAATCSLGGCRALPPQTRGVVRRDDDVLQRSRRLSRGARGVLGLLRRRLGVGDIDEDGAQRRRRRDWRSRGARGALGLLRRHGAVALQQLAQGDPLLARLPAEALRRGPFLHEAPQLLRARQLAQPQELHEAKLAGGQDADEHANSEEVREPHMLRSRRQVLVDRIAHGPHDEHRDDRQRGAGRRGTWVHKELDVAHQQEELGRDDDLVLVVLGLARVGPLQVEVLPAQQVLDSALRLEAMLRGTFGEVPEHARHGQGDDAHAAPARAEAPVPGRDPQLAGVQREGGHRDPAHLGVVRQPAKDGLGLHLEQDLLGAVHGAVGGDDRHDAVGRSIARLHDVVEVQVRVPDSARLLGTHGNGVHAATGARPREGEPGVPPPGAEVAVELDVAELVVHLVELH